MPISLRIPTEIEDQIAGFSARQGLSKSAVIVRSIHEFLARSAQRSSFQISEKVMRDGVDESNDAKREATGQRPHKILVRDAIRQKHVTRSERASLNLTNQTKQPNRAKPNEHVGRFGLLRRTVQYRRPPPHTLQIVFCWLLRSDDDDLGCVYRGVCIADR